MGTKFAPTYPTLVPTFLGEKLLSEIDIKCYLFYGQLNFFSDDCFVFWTKGEGYLKTFHSSLNELHINMKLTKEYSEEICHFSMFY